MSGDWWPLAKVDEIPERTLWAVDCAGKPWIVIRDGEDVRCFFDRCSHQDVKLSEFAQIDAQGGILCFAHGARFCPNTGDPLCFPGSRPLWVADVKRDGEQILIRLPDDLPDV